MLLGTLSIRSPHTFSPEISFRSMQLTAPNLIGSYKFFRISFVKTSLEKSIRAHTLQIAMDLLLSTMWLLQMTKTMDFHGLTCSIPILQGSELLTLRGRLTFPSLGLFFKPIPQRYQIIHWTPSTLTTLPSKQVSVWFGIHQKSHFSIILHYSLTYNGKHRLDVHLSILGFQTGTSTISCIGSLKLGVTDTFVEFIQACEEQLRYAHPI